MYELFPLQDFTDGQSLKLLYVSSYRHENSPCNVFHAHRFAEIFFCIDGEGEFFIRDQSIKVHANDFIFINPLVNHTEASSDKHPLEWVALGVEGACMPLEHSSKGFYCGNLAEKKNLMLQLLIELLTQAKLACLELCDAIFRLILCYLGQLSAHEITNTAPSRTHISHNIAWIKQYIDDYYARPIKLDELAAKIGINKYSLIRDFKKAYHVSPIEHLLNRRFEEACFLLCSTEQSVRHIAEALSFSSANYFSQCFQKRLGMTPTEYRYHKPNGSSALPPLLPQNSV